MASTFNNIFLIISEETAKEIEKMDEEYIMATDEFSEIVFYTKDTNKIKEEEKNLKNIVKEFSKEETEAFSYINDFNEEIRNSNLIEEAVLYSFIIIISLLSVVNIFNTIYSSIILRRRELAVLKSMGMSNKQIKKMLLFESIFYGLDALIYGILISIVILYILYILKIQTNIYAFIIPWKKFIICFLATYITIFASMLLAKIKVDKQNIIDSIKKENI